LPKFHTASLTNNTPDRRSDATFETKSNLVGTRFDTYV
jgi:hypothetical protein